MKAPEELQGMETKRHPFEDEICLRENGNPRINVSSILRQVAEAIQETEKSERGKLQFNALSDIALLESDLAASENLNRLADKLENGLIEDTTIPSRPSFCEWSKITLRDAGIDPETVRLEYHNEIGWLFMPGDSERIFATFYSHESFAEQCGDQILAFQDFGSLKLFRALAQTWLGLKQN